MGYIRLKVKQLVSRIENRMSHIESGMSQIEMGCDSFTNHHIDLFLTFYCSPSHSDSRWHLGYIFVPVNALVAFSLALFFLRLHIGLGIV